MLWAFAGGYLVMWFGTARWLFRRWQGQFYNQVCSRKGAGHSCTWDQCVMVKDEHWSDADVTAAAMAAALVWWVILAAMAIRGEWPRRHRLLRGKALEDLEKKAGMMFYCDPCAEKKAWPKTLFRSDGPCEVCGKTAVCNDTPSKYLPLPKARPDKAREA